jgi:hypothetical protein
VAGEVVEDEVDSLAGILRGTALRAACAQGLGHVLERGANVLQLRCGSRGRDRRAGLRSQPDLRNRGAPRDS